jgi:hypothetical protein
LRDQHGAQPWPPLDRRDDPQPPGGLRGRIGRLRRDLRPGPLPPCLDAATEGPAVRAATSAGGKAAAPRHRCTSDQMPGQATRGGRFQAGAARGGRASPSRMATWTASTSGSPSCPASTPAAYRTATRAGRPSSPAVPPWRLPGAGRTLLPPNRRCRQLGRCPLRGSLTGTGTGRRRPASLR